MKEFELKLNEQELGVILTCLSEQSKLVGLQTKDGFNVSALGTIVTVADNIIKQVNKQQEQVEVTE